MKLKKGSAAAKAYMAKIRAKRKKVKKSAIAKPKRAAKKAVKAARKKAAKKVTSMHKDTKSHNVRISVVSGVNPYLLKIQSGISQIEKELKEINTDLKNPKFNKGPLLKKSLQGRKRYLTNELRLGKQMLKKF
jgi:hypothetical protein